ncbi:MAG: rod shape-determining protein RodA [Candidatus Nomurabacteria bacterium]|nr:rod shape-determining protein RodA [Candidatus Nomurabacteria bacterium]USN88170.1 MAG: rod shape-determining protein RodA [Candidatus Nomurabacteria bacterium]
MRRLWQTVFSGFDGILFGAIMCLTIFGLVTMYSPLEDNIFFNRQIIWVLIVVWLFFVAIIPNYRFLRTGNTVFYLYLLTVVLLVLVLFFGETILGARQRFDLGFFSLQVSDPTKLILIALLAKYFAKRHELIGDFKHILVSGFYVLIPFGLILVQPDFGSAMIIFAIWFGMVLVAGLKFRHVVVVFMLGLVALGGMWQFVFQDYQKDRIMTFVDPLADIQGTGYNAYQSTVTVGSGQIFGKGIGYGTQSKFLYLPEYETDFIFAAFAEEWGIIGVLVMFSLFGVVIWRLLYHATLGVSNFEKLFAVGVVIFLLAHFFVHVGINIGVLPVTGTTIPFMSYGGSHLVTEFVAVAMVLGMSRAQGAKAVAKETPFVD